MLAQSWQCRRAISPRCSSLLHARHTWLSTSGSYHAGGGTAAPYGSAMDPPALAVLSVNSVEHSLQTFDPLGKSFGASFTHVPQNQNVHATQWAFPGATL